MIVTDLSTTSLRPQIRLWLQTEPQLYTVPMPIHDEDSYDASPLLSPPVNHAPLTLSILIQPVTALTA